ncbi:hypothetical protein AVEN_260940-1, partial [Araneus ventricosus]
LDTLCRIKTCGYSSLVKVFDCFPISPFKIPGDENGSLSMLELFCLLDG